MTRAPHGLVFQELLEMSENLEELEAYSAHVVYAKMKTIADILNYIRNFTDAKLIFDKRSIDKLYICTQDPRPRPPGGDNPK